MEHTSFDPHIGDKLAENTPHYPFKIDGNLADLMSNRKLLQDRNKELQTNKTINDLFDIFPTLQILIFVVGISLKR